MLRLIGNILWIVLGGWAVALEYLFAGAILCLTIIGIPLGLQVMKLGVLGFIPFGVEVVDEVGRRGSGAGGQGNSFSLLVDHVLHRTAFIFYIFMDSPNSSPPDCFCYFNCDRQYYFLGYV